MINIAQCNALTAYTYGKHKNIDLKRVCGFKTNSPF